MRQRLLLFAKRPRLGKVKTRLCPPLVPQQALALYRAFLEDQIRFLRSQADRREVEICYDGPVDDERYAELRLSDQGAGNLGERLARATERTHAEGVGAVVVIGVDSPTLPVSRVDQAFEALRGQDDCVLQPSVDGGYVLVGLRRPAPALFQGISWGSEKVFAQSCRGAHAAGLELTTLPAWYDIDDAWGLSQLRRELTTPDAERRAPATARFLKAWTRQTGP